MRRVAHVLILAFALLAMGCEPPSLENGHLLPIACGDAVGTSTYEVDHLPCLRVGVRTQQASSYDRSGGNADGSHYNLGRDPETGHYIVLDEQGSGTIHRIWLTGADVRDGPVAIYLDDQNAPSIAMGLQDLFSGSQRPFLFPLAGNADVSSGGYYLSYPLSFSTSARIEFAETPQYYNITYHLYDRPDLARPFDAQQSLGSAYPTTVGSRTDPKHRRPSLAFTTALDVPAGEETKLLDAVMAGAVGEIRISLPQLEGADHQDIAALLGGTRIRMSWDGASEPDVDVPLGYLFGLGSGGMGAVESMMFGVATDSYELYNYFPMPFTQHAQIILSNDSRIDIRGGVATIRVDQVRYDRAGYFVGVHQAERPTTEGQSYTLVDTGGRGHVVATVMDVSQFDDWGLLEGDEQIYIDGSETAQIHGTGFEDFFNGGWYFNKGPFTLPLHGAPLIRGPDGRKHVVAYRLTLADAITFYDGIRFTMEHGRTNDLNADFESAVFLYMERRDRP